MPLDTDDVNIIDSHLVITFKNIFCFKFKIL